MKYSSKKGDFLDDNVTENSKSKVVTSLYTKPRYIHSLHSTSCHCASCKNALPHSQAIRIKRTCSSKSKR